MVQKSPPTLAVAQNTVYLLAQQGQATASGSFSLANASPEGSFSWSATNITPAWLSVIPATGTATATPSTVVVRATLSGLGLGTHTGSFTVNAGSAGSKTIQVQLKIVTSLKRTYLPTVRR